MVVSRSRFCGGGRRENGGLGGGGMTGAGGGSELWHVTCCSCNNGWFTLGKLMMRIASKGHFFTQIPQPLEGRVCEMQRKGK